MLSVKPRTLILTMAVVCALVFSAVVLAGCGCSRDKDGDDVKKKSKTPEVATVVGSWHLTQAMDQNNESLELDAATLKQCTIIIRSDMTATMSFPDGTHLGKITRTPEADMGYADAWNQYSVEAYTFSTSDGEVEIEFGFIVRNDGSQEPFIVMPIDTVNYYYDK